MTAIETSDPALIGVAVSSSTAYRRPLPASSLSATMEVPR